MFLERKKALPVLGIGVSTEFGAASSGGFDIHALARQMPEAAQFLELGVELRKGFDKDAIQWIQEKRATTYHFLDVNLQDIQYEDPIVIDEMRMLLEQSKAAWICGDAGLWYFNQRDPQQMLLLPPLLCLEEADAMAQGICYLRDSLQREVLPENPPGTVFVGNMHLLDFFKRMITMSDTGMLLDVAHLAIYQKIHGYQPTEGLDRFPIERIVEIHIAGGRHQTISFGDDEKDFQYIEDDHSLNVLPETWEIVDALLQHGVAAKAVVCECERNLLSEVIEKIGLWRPRLLQLLEQNDVE